MAWDLNNIKTLLDAHNSWSIESEDNCLSISNDEGLDAFLYAGEQQIIVESLLFPLSSVRDEAVLNQMILRTHQLQPLTGISIKMIGGAEYYVAFGALSTQSKDSVLLEEIETLFINVGEFLELYADHLNCEV
ncbi:hypothetical protein GCM10011297_24700 [Bacterioplanes sanyensis]|uniref:DUF2170 family protein n=1 Tax=Bacterioplanes sanyensis TaxID=1249553 RepID=UPI0016739FA1|nr:DUF2170 family protein [Bacterioplanes sanyensis]GGY50875.1 hypothetical protein GCM10011297_24700 [Bacterioplanes sanyensis]